MNCGKAIEGLVESARRRTEPDALLRAHLDHCPACLDRWESERGLTSGLRIMRIEASTHRTPRAAREALMREFAAKNPALIYSGWAWTLAAAAVLLLTIALVRHWQPSPAPFVAENGGSVAEVQAAVEAQNDGFIAVPFVPPLATGETVRIVHTELFPAALASLGVNVDPAWTTELPADLLVGEDGFPRAVRVSDDYSDAGGF